MKSRSRTLRILLATAVIAALPFTGAGLHAHDGQPHLDSAILSELAAARGATAQFQNFEQAAEAGWWFQASPCEETAAGGMGHHYVNLDTWGAPLDITRPQALLYEPTRNGRLRLVGVEYIVPRAVVGPEGPPPVLFGQELHWNPVAVGGIWALHVWLWRHNPSGIFANWNPQVTCEYAQ